MHCAGQSCAVRPDEGGPAQKTLKDTLREAISCIAHDDDGAVRCSPATRPLPAGSCLSRLTATRACRHHYNHQPVHLRQEPIPQKQFGCARRASRRGYAPSRRVQWPGRAAAGGFDINAARGLRPARPIRCAWSTAATTAATRTTLAARGSTRKLRRFHKN